MVRHKELADFLKTRRARIHPSQIGLPAGSRRRTSGLRREEVALLAGVGLTWYTWLEQGRPIQVSAQVVESLSRALQLTRQEQLHFYRLANQPLPAMLPSIADSISPSLQQVLDQLLLAPAFIMDARWNVLGWNPAASFVFGDFSKLLFSERNMLWLMFMKPDYRNLFCNWEHHARGMIGRFRAAYDQYWADPWFAAFIERIREQSPEFATFWSTHDVLLNDATGKELQHPLAGLLQFSFNSFDVSDHSGLTLIINTPLAASDTATKLQPFLTSSFPQPQTISADN